MTLKKKTLTVFYLMLRDAKIDSLADARIRDAFATKQLFEVLKTFEEDRKKIYDEMAVKDKDGNPDVIKGAYNFGSKEKEDEAKKEVETLLEEEVELTPANPAKIKQFIEGSKYIPQMGDMEVIDDILAKLK